MADELDSLYLVDPKDFTAERTKLVAAARRRGDDAAAKRISAARKPTAAAWIANRLALRHKDTKRRLADLGEKLRVAHAAMDGARIRDLSTEQHHLIGELTRTAFDAADMRTPSSAVRDDLISTLQAAIADPEVRARLGRLTRPEQWSGFGTPDDAAPVTRAEGTEKVRRQQREKAAAIAAAERAKAKADDELSRRQAELDAAHLRRDEALATLKTAERQFTKAGEKYDEARAAAQAAAQSLQQAKAR
ncbi:MAG: hypothetical protein JOZ00_22830 [Mycobacterium sp.]|uniref:hypothetical protein n=1 Tax=Mycobacterium sp. TaxID=1785 RepID=UPI001EB61245|nr:hypothetical protein [Mycobacterium sp.]MBV8789499.1 hypothetical protein [Mycobacterium sp.]